MTVRNDDNIEPVKNCFSISVIIPCYNEAENIVDAVMTIINGLDVSNLEYEIILVDDGSMDNSRDLIRALLETDTRIHAVFHSVNLGKGAALRSGFERARMNWILMMDADLQIDISELNLFLPYCGEYDIITGFRKDRKEGIIRSFVSKLYNLIASVVIGISVRDVGCPFKLLKTSVVNTMPLTSNGFVVDAEIFLFSKTFRCRIKEQGVNCNSRLKGESTVKFRHFIQTFIELIKLRKRAH